MNLSEAVSFVLKHDGQSLLSGFLREDLKVMMAEIKVDLSAYLKRPDVKKEKLLKKKFRTFRDNSIDTIAILRELPIRIKDGGRLFREGVINEIDRIEDPKEKTVFSLKVIMALTSTTAGAVYGFKKSKIDFRFKGLKNPSSLTSFFVLELLLKISHLFMIRFIDNVEKHVTDQKDIKKLRFCRQMLFGEVKEVTPLDNEDKAFKLVDSLKNYILTGKES